MVNLDMKPTIPDEMIDLFKKGNHFIITSHINLDGDALGSEIALYLMLKQLQKDVRIINQDPIPSVYQFLPNVQEIINAEGQVHRDFYYDIKPGTILIVLDSSNLERIGELFIDMKQISFIVNIDHHPSNAYFGDYNYINTEASSVGEILFQLGRQMKCRIDEQIAVSLYTAMITDTGSFRYANTNAGTFQVAAYLVQSGANPNRIADNIYNKNSASSLKILGEALCNLKIDPYCRISWTVITRDMIEKAQSKDEEIEGIVDRILSVKDIQVSALFRETRKEDIKISFRSKGEFNVDLFARLFGGGGHPNAAGCQFKGDIKEAVQKVITRLKTDLCVPS